MSQKQKFRPTLRLTVSTLLAFVILVTTASLTLLNYHSSTKTLREFSNEVIAKTSGVVQEQVNAFFREAKTTNKLILKLTDSDLIDTKNLLEVERYFFNFLTTHENVTMLNFGNLNGDYVMVRRSDDGSLHTKLILRDEYKKDWVLWKRRDPGARFNNYWKDWNIDSYDPRARPWFQGAMKLGRLYWTDVYVFYTTQTPGVTASVPLKDELGRIKGVLAVDVDLMDLSFYLKEHIKVGKTGHSFIMDEQRRLVATDQPKNLIHVPNGIAKKRLFKINETPNKEISALRQNKEFNDFYRMVFHQNMIPPGQKTIHYEINGVKHIARLNVVNFDSGKRWLSAIVAKEDDFIGVAKKDRTKNLFIGIIFTLLALSLGMYIVNKIVGRLRDLVEESQKVKVMQLNDNLVHSNFKEIHEVLQAFEGMKTGLRAFKKYVPVNLVRKLINNKTEPTLGGVPKTLTILFSDIQDFTSISEKLSPTEIGDYLGKYLSIVAGEVLESEGTVDKYIGDAVMAFWGAPNHVENQAHKACEAALKITKNLEKFQEENPHIPVFHTRIGIHTDNVVVGNFGSMERLNYTVIGDGVNLASRLEGVNKFFGTQILISEDTKNLIDDDFECRKMGEVEVKGRSKPTVIYELLGKQSEISLPQREANRLLEEAIEYFEKGNPQAAYEKLSKAKALSPDDKVIHHVEKFIKDTLNGDHHLWNGVIKIESK